MRVDGTQHSERHAWRRWALFFGLPCAALALASVWLFEPRSLGAALGAVGAAMVALLVFVLTMPRRKAAARRAPRQPREGSSGEGV
jgi:hypothetical protein